jgi:hypothetical protein
MSLAPLQSPFEDLGVHREFNSQNGSSFGSVRVHSLTLSYTFGSMDVTPRFLSWLAPLQAFALVANPRLGLRHTTKKWCVKFFKIITKQVDEVWKENMK